MKYRLIFVVFALSCSGIQAQQIILDKNVDEQYNATHGPNMRHYSHFYMGGGFVMPFDEKSGAKTDFVRSWQYSFGYRYKLKLLSFYAVGLDAGLRYFRYHIEDEKLIYDPSKPLTMASIVDKFSVGISSLGLEAYNRINIGSRGNTLGQYIDIGFRGEWNYSTREIIKQKLGSTALAERMRTVNRGLKYIESFSTFVTAGIGYNKISLFGYYCLSDLFKNKYGLVELPSLIIGLQIKI